MVWAGPVMCCCDVPCSGSSETWDMARDKGVAEVVRYAVECLNFDIDLKTARQ